MGALLLGMFFCLCICPCMFQPLNPSSSGALGRVPNG